MLSACHQAAGNATPIARKPWEGNETVKRWPGWSSATKPRLAAGYSKKTGNRDPGQIAALLSRPYLEQVTRNCKDESEAYRALIAMAVGLDDCKDQVQQAMGIRHQKPQKAQLREEAKRRYIVLGLESTNYRPYKPNKSWKAPHILKWLEEHPITAPDCIRFVKSELAAGTGPPLDNKTFLEGRQKLFDNMSRIMSTKDEHNAADFFKVVGNFAATTTDVTMADPSSSSDGSPFSSSMIKSQGTLTSQQLSLMNMTNLSPSESELCSSRWSETTNAAAEAAAVVAMSYPPMETPTIVEVANRKLHDASGKRGLYTGQCLVHHSPNGVRTLEPHQKGKMKYRNGRVVYDGEWKNGQRHGRGRLEEYCDQPAASSSTMTSQQQQQQQQQQQDRQLLIYEGEWKQNRRDGVGAQRYSNGVWLHSNWTKNRPVGQGHYVLCGGNNNIQVAAIDGKSCNCHARHVWDDGSWYEGEWKEGWQQGNGIKGYANGVTLSSRWVKDCPVGEGVYTFANNVQRSCEDGKVQEARQDQCTKARGSTASPFHADR